MKLPIHRRIDSILTSNNSVLIKVSLCSLVTASVALLGYFKETRRPGSTFSLSPEILGLFALGWATLGAAFELILSYKDAVARRVASGQRTGRLSKFYFAGAVRSLLAWFITIFFGVFLVTIIAAVAGVL